MRRVENLTWLIRTAATCTVAFHPPCPLVHRFLLPCWRKWRLLELSEVVLIIGFLCDESSIIPSVIGLAHVLIGLQGLPILCASGLARCASEDVIVWLVLGLTRSVGELPLVLFVIVSRFSRLMLIVDVVSAILGESVFPLLHLSRSGHLLSLAHEVHYSSELLSLIISLRLALPSASSILGTFVIVL